ncbi:MAG: hypothetical protein RIF33_19245 [Cyclobacteriaceae bacterium]
MDKTIDKELMDHLIRLEADQQEMVLGYIKNLLLSEEMNNRAVSAEEDIKSGRTKTLQQFDQEFEEWKLQKRANLT